MVQINRQRILAKARRRGLRVFRPDDRHRSLWAYLRCRVLHTEVVTDVSGRGVGMDVVRRNIQAMGGRVEIESMLGIGTAHDGAAAALTLAILDGMSVAVGDQIYILPLSAVVESLQLNPAISKPQPTKDGLFRSVAIICHCWCCTKSLAWSRQRPISQVSWSFSMPVTIRPRYLSTNWSGSIRSSSRASGNLSTRARRLRRSHHGRWACRDDSGCLSHHRDDTNRQQTK